LPQPVFTAPTVCQGSPTIFTDATISQNGGISNWTWVFGDGNTATNLQNPTNTYTTSGDYNVTLTAVDGIGCTNSVTQSVHVGNFPVADFTFQEACLGSATCFTNSATSSPDPLLDFVWDFGTVPASSSLVSDPCYSFLASGTYQVSYYVKTNYGCQSPTVVKQVEVHDTPLSDFTFTSVCAGFPTDFTDASTIQTDAITNWEWNFGTVPPSTAVSVQNTSHTYNVGGNYSVKHKVYSSFGCSSTATKIVTVYPKPLAKYAFSTVCEGTQTSFNSNSSVANPDNLVQYDWDFNIGESNLSGTNQSPGYTFLNYGVKPVKLTVTSDHGCVDDTTRNVTVFSMPVTDFTFSNVCSGFPISFTNTTTNADGQFSSNWNFGSPIIGFPYTTQVNPTVTYNTAGPYNVTLKTTTTHGCVATKTQTVEIYPIPQARFGSPPICFKNTFLFSDSSIVSNLFNDSISIWAWTFGDAPPSGTSNLKNPAYNYQSYGTYTVNLTATSNHGCTNSTHKDVIVYPVPLVQFQSNDACATHATQFFNNTQMYGGLVSHWNWDFDGLSSSTDSSVNYLFPAAGTYNVTLSATTDKNCTVDTIIPVLVNPMPIVNFAADTLIGCQPLTVRFDDLTLNPTGYTVSQWQWSFGDAKFSNQHPRATNIYDAYGNFNVQLILTTSAGCKDSLTKPNYITVWPKPIADFAITPQPATELDAWIAFTDLSKLEVNKWWWDFGIRDSTSDVSTNQNGQYLYPDTGTYYATLMVENRYGCRDTLVRPVVIRPDFVFYIPNAFTPQDSRDNINEIFNGYGTGIQDYDMRIYNRWGENIYHSKDKNLGWNGQVRGGSDLCQQDVYVYVFEILDIHQKFHIYRGHVTLVRSH
jgi:gliding motility-associated-like protein